jgi:glutamate racemase
MDAQAPIGVFDSGIGGLTVLRELILRLPGEDFVYLGDTARVPYGTKSAQTVARYSLNNLAFFHRQRVKLVVVACNTASAYALDTLKDLSEVPVIGVVEPGARAAIRRSKTRIIGVIGTRGTIKSRAYEHRISDLDPEVQVMGWPCPLLVPLAEEGFTKGEIPRSVVLHYLSGLARIAPRIDTLLLACTHYPLLMDLLDEQADAIFDAKVSCVDSATAVAQEVMASLDELQLGCGRTEEGRTDFYVTDLTRFEEIGQRFLGRPIRGVKQVDIGQLE